MARSQAERQIILLSASTAACRHAMREQAGQLMADLDWLQLTETLRLRKLLPALGPRILELAEQHASHDFASAVEEAVETGRRQGAFLQLIALRTMDALAEAGIHSTPLKGPMLGEAIYGDPGRRPSSDIDLLVAPEQLHSAVDVVRGLGYGAPTDYMEQGDLPLLHFALVHERGELPPVELHWRIHWYEGQFARERLLPPVTDLAGDWRPAPVDELAALLLFYARDGFVDLRLATDLSAWWDVFGAGLPLGALDGLLRAYPALARAIPVALKVTEKIVGLPATRIIKNMPRSDYRQRLATRLADPNPHASPSQLYANMGLIDGLLTPPGGFGGYIRRQVLLPPKVFDEHAKHYPQWRARSRLDYGLRILARYCLAMIRAVRTPETLLR
jgi:hypothetical protein